MENGRSDRMKRNFGICRGGTLLGFVAAQGQTYRDAFPGLSFKVHAAVPLVNLPAKPSSWGTDGSGRLYFLGHDNGKVYMLEGSDWAGGPVGMIPREGMLRGERVALVNGFNPALAVRITSGIYILSGLPQAKTQDLLLVR